MSYVISDINEYGQKTDSMYEHFSRIAAQYHHLRTTDIEPVNFMIQKLKQISFIRAADIGCGDGRYDRILCQELGQKLSLTCVDANADMLEALHKNLDGEGIENYISMQSKAEELPLPDDSYDCILSLNAIHHFDLNRFITECSRILKNGGYLFIYTRLREQNKRNIWGMHFPEFIQKETRLATIGKITKALDDVTGMWLQSIEYFKYGRLCSLNELEKKIRSHHYSTFFLYTMDELEQAIDKFRERICKNFQDINKIYWYDENVLFVVRKTKESKCDFGISNYCTQTNIN
jgi:ubiquinone/menaquinone biosynthesis C-methylase UbiE